MRHYGPVFAVMLARLIGYRQPLIDRLNDCDVQKTPAEHEFIASRLADPVEWPTREQVLESREKLRRAAYFLEYLHGNGGRVTAENAGQLRKKAGSKMTAADAEVLAAHKCKVDPRTIRRNVSEYAKVIGGGEWWVSAEHLAKKSPRKRDSLHRTY